MNREVMKREVVEVVDGLYFGEAPRWHEGRLWFSDFYEHAVLSVSAEGDLRTGLSIDDQPSGLGWMPDGSLLVVGMTKRQVLRRDTDGKVSVWANLSDIATFHCNDMVVDAQGRAYVGNFGMNIDEEAQLLHLMGKHSSLQKRLAFASLPSLLTLMAHCQIVEYGLPLKGACPMVFVSMLTARCGSLTRCLLNAFALPKAAKCLR